VRARNRKRQAAGLAVAGVCTLVFAGVWVSAGQRSAVLELARPVAVGQVIASGDVRTVLVGAGAGAGVPLIAADRKDSVVGSTVTGSLPAGTLLTGQMLGAPSVPVGQVTLALPVKEGQYPPRLGAGAPVSLYATGTNAAAPSTAGAGGAGTALAQGVVLEVTPSQTGDGASVVTVRVPQSAAGAVAQAQTVDVVELPTAQSGGGN
jgi:hypothetical protein